MPFGKYKDKPLSSIPDSYLCWLLAECKLRPWLRAAVLAESRRREGGDEPNAGPLVNWAPIIRSWYRDLALRFHPDRGGSLQAMQTINEAHDRLREAVGI